MKQIVQLNTWTYAKTLQYTKSENQLIQKNDITLTM